MFFWGLILITCALVSWAVVYGVLHLPQLRRRIKVRRLLREGAIDRVLDLLEKQGELREALVLAKQHHRYARAARIYEIQGDILRAARSFERCGDKRKSAELFVKEGYLKKAAQLYAEIKALPEFAAYLTQSGQRPLAIRVLLMGDYYSEAADLLVEDGKLLEASITLSFAFQRAKSLSIRSPAYARLGQACANALLATHQWRRAARVLIEIRHYTEAAQCFAAHQDFEAAAEICRRIGEYQEAYRYLVSGGHTEKAMTLRGEMYLREGSPYLAIDCFVKAQNFRRAADTYCDLQETQAAAEMYERAQQWDLAATFFQHSRSYARAAALFEKIGDPEKALECYRQAGDLNQELRILKARKAWLDMAKAYARVGDWPMVLETLKEVAPQHADYAKAQELHARALLETPTQHKLPLGEAPAVEAPQVVDTGRELRYIPMEEIGRGGMGVVYKALDTALDRILAFKVLPVALRNSPRAIHTFLREARVSASLNHPNVVTVYDAGMQDGTYFIAMELVEGETLKSRIYKNPPLTYTQIQTLFKLILLGIHHAHSRQLIHRDINPNNIMVTPQGGLKIMDFGLAKVTKDMFPEQSVLGGTPSYMSPEQTKGGTIDVRSDIYSLGVTLFELCLRRVPFNQGDLAYHHVHTPAPDPRQLEPQIPELLAQIILKCMEKNPAHRFQSVEEMLLLVDERGNL